MTGQTHLLYSDLPKAPGLPQGLSTNRIIGKIYTTHKLIIHQRKWSAKSLYICIQINFIWLPSKTLNWWIRRQKDQSYEKDGNDKTTEAKETKQGFGKHYHSVRASESKRVTAIYHLKIFNTTYPMSWEGGQYLLKEWPGCDGGMWYLT